MTLDETVLRLQGLAAAAAEDAASLTDATDMDRCHAAIIGLLEVFDGKSPYFPKCSLSPNPHEEDMQEARASGARYLDPNIPLMPGLAEMYRSRVETGNWSWPESSESTPQGATARAYTSQEVTEMFLSSMRGAAEFWAQSDVKGFVKIKGPTFERCSGAIFSAFAVLDGVNAAAPMFDILLDADDIASRPELSGFEPIILDAYLHESLSRVEPYRGAGPMVAPEEGDWPDIPDTPEQRALIETENENIRRKFPNLVQIDPPVDPDEDPSHG